jgi:two-component system, NtrC family, sensor histidine kinase HydH
MSRESIAPKKTRYWLILYIGLFATVSIFVILLAWLGIRHDFQQLKQTLLNSESGRLRSHAIRTVARIQDELHNSTTSDLIIMRENADLRNNWERFLKNDESRVYAAIVDTQDRIIVHNRRNQEGLSLAPIWYETTVQDSEDMVYTRDPALAMGRSSIDIQVPILNQDKAIGFYHTGLSVDWLDQEYASKQAASSSNWITLLILMVILEVLAAMILVYFIRRITRLEEHNIMMHSRRLAEIGQLMAGIVHEIRNPLNAMRLNLHVLGRNLTEQGPLPDYEHCTLDLIQESQSEIDRIEGLLRILLGYARPDDPRLEVLDVRKELQTTLNFLKPLLERREVLVVARLPEPNLQIMMDRDRLRQVMLNLLNNACDAMPRGGTIEITANVEKESLELRFQDQGSGIPANQRERIFDPFFSTKPTGTGLGLAIVRRHIEDAGGTVQCAEDQASGALFIIRLPIHQIVEINPSISQ